MADLRTHVRSTRIGATLLAVAFAIAFVGLYTTAILTAQGQRWDAASLGALPSLRGEGLLGLYATRVWLPFILLGLAAAAGLEAMVRRRWVAVVAAGSLVSLTALASYTFKEGLLPRPDVGEQALSYAYQTFPSGHTAMSLAVVVSIVWFGPRWLNPTGIVVLGVVVGFVAVASFLSFAHRASDIVGGALLVGALACATSATIGTPPLPRDGARVAWTAAGFVGITSGAALYAIALATLDADADATDVVFVDQIGLSAIAAVGGVIAVVLANQYPARMPSAP